jgi:hypothetical protein
MARLPRPHRRIRRNRLAGIGIGADAELIARAYDIQTLPRLAEQMAHHDPRRVIDLGPDACISDSISGQTANQELECFQRWTFPSWASMTCVVVATIGRDLVAANERTVVWGRADKRSRLTDSLRSAMPQREGGLPLGQAGDPRALG